MQGLVAICFGHTDPIAQTFGFRGVNVCNRGVYLPTLGLLRGEWQWLEHNSNGKQIVHFLEWNLLALHLRPYRVDALDATRDLEIDAVSLQCFDNRGIETGDIFVEMGGNIFVYGEKMRCFC